MAHKYPIIVIEEIIKDPYFQEKINNNEFTKLYVWLNQEYQDYNNIVIGRTTELLYDAGINPLLYMNMVPLNFGAGMTIKKLNIPNNIDIIGDYAFEYSIIEEITIPNSIIKIGDRAFGGCKKIKIKYLGNTYQWLNIDIGFNINDFYMLKTTIECMNGNISYVAGKPGEGVVPKINKTI